MMVNVFLVIALVLITLSLRYIFLELRNLGEWVRDIHYKVYEKGKEVQHDD